MNFNIKGELVDNRTWNEKKTKFRKAWFYSVLLVLQSWIHNFLKIIGDGLLLNSDYSDTTIHRTGTGTVQQYDSTLLPVR